jgi:hypothetical protein
MLVAGDAGNLNMLKKSEIRMDWMFVMPCAPLIQLPVLSFPLFYSIHMKNHILQVHGI